MKITIISLILYFSLVQSLIISLQDKQQQLQQILLPTDTTNKEYKQKLPPPTNRLLNEQLQTYQYRYSQQQKKPFINKQRFTQIAEQVEPPLPPDQLHSIINKHQEWMGINEKYVKKRQVGTNDDAFLHDYCPRTKLNAEAKEYCHSSLDVRCLMGSEYFGSIALFYLFVQMMALVFGVVIFVIFKKMKRKDNVKSDQ